MPSRILAFALSVPLIALLALAAACDGDGAGGEATPTIPAATATPEEATPEQATPGVTPTPGSSIRQEDLGDEPAVTEFLASAGGEVEISRIQYGDLTQDGVEEALLVVSSGGEGSDIAAFVYGYGAEGLEELFRIIPEGGAMKVEIDLGMGQLKVIEPVYGPGDPRCCPSELRTTIYRWDGSKLAVATQQVVPAR